jgi:hypothetical protein
MSRSASLSLAAVAACFAVTSAAGGATTITIDPTAGTPDTAFNVSIPALYPIRQIKDRYWFIVHGPGGRQCDTSVTDRVGITPPRRAKTVAVSLPGVRVIGDPNDPGLWCPGTFNGRVEFRDWRPSRHRYVIHRIGTFSFTVVDNSVQGQ